MNESVKKVEGIVEEALPGTTFRVKCGDKTVLAHLAGKMRMHYIKILPGDRVTMEVSSYDETKGRIIRRL
ncbi:MAG: translation initiation factor IF-1 [Candidatus Pacebacteria bacterium]|nr:translation initiation factor IF-1 [Candidatus Paceibacterota bacterium]